MMRLVFDTNCYIAAASQPNGYMASWMEAALNGEAFELYVSPEILAELQRKLESKMGYQAKESVAYRRFIERIATIVYPTVRLEVVRDPKDNIILECAVEAAADLLISMDRDLLSMKQFESIKIAHPRMLKYWFKEL